MLTDWLIKFNSIGDDIKDCATDLEVCFEQSNELFTIVGIYPYAVLQTEKP